MGLSLAALLHLHLWAPCYWAFQCQNMGHSEFRLDGDYTIAGLFSIHSSIVTMKSRPERPDPFSHGYHLFQAMRFSVEEINNSGELLPNVTLGYEIYDICSESANMYATLSILAQSISSSSHLHVEVLRDFTLYQPKAVAVIGPDSSNLALSTAAILSIALVPEISYEASSQILSAKYIYPSFLRTIPSDRLQVEALVRLLLDFNWTWVAVVASDNAYGRQGLQTLYEVATKKGICVAYQGILSLNVISSSLELEKMVQRLVVSRANVTIVFSNRRVTHSFLKGVIQQNVTEKVWLGTEDWSLVPEIWGTAGISSIGTVIGVSLKHTPLPGLMKFESAYISSMAVDSNANCQANGESCNQICTQCRKLTPNKKEVPTTYDTQAAFNTYSAVHAVAHGLHHLLGCHTGACHKKTVYPWQLLEEIKHVNFTLYDRQVYFDNNGDLLIGYNIIQWNWDSQDWNFSIIGSFTRNPDRLSIDKHRIRWHTEGNKVPISRCSKACEAGEKRLQQGMHQCCFQCVACPSGTFLNKSDPFDCQPCGKEEWAPVKSETCSSRTIVFLPWNDPISWALLTATTLLLLLMAGTAVIFALNLGTPVVKSAGGQMCLVMLGSLACACCSLYCYFGEPAWLTCLLRLPLFSINFTLCLSCLVARSFQIVFIFKMAAKAPGLHEACRKYHGPTLFIGASTSLQTLMSLISLVTTTPVPRKNYDKFMELIILECSDGSSLIHSLGQFYCGLLAILCFVISYMGKDLPESYNETKCIAFSLLMYFISLIAYYVISSVYQGKYLPAMLTVSNFSTLSGIFVGYFLPKAYIILFRAELNTTEYFQTSIQSYTTKRSSD
uniref:Taste 1 receptor member 1 n=1 Tax=Sphenodon punctatus TaxID=8508 RepID=A0A8D0H7A9_SPHPU